MAGHTPGPWNKDRHEQLRGSNGQQVGTWPASVAWVSKSDEAEANARLIAAAPELLEALEDLVALVRGECPSLLNEDSGGNGVLDIKIDAAINKATQP